MLIIYIKVLGKLKKKHIPLELPFICFACVEYTLIYTTLSCYLMT